MARTKYQSKRDKREREVAEQDVQLIKVEINNRAEKNGGDKRWNENTPTGKNPEREYYVNGHETEKKCSLRNANVSYKSRNISNPVVRRAEETVGRV